ncbi:hypothetical protein ACS0TY_025956 [Phlomoides rotata]
MERFYPDTYQEEMESKFFGFQQGNLTVDEYEREFSNLARFAGTMADTEQKKAKKFKKGLRPEIRSILAGHREMPLSEVVKRAGEIAASLQTQGVNQKPAENLGKRRWDDHNKSNDNNQNKQARSQNNTTPACAQSNSTAKGFQGATGANAQPVKPTCTNCGRNHWGECLSGQGKCFRCRQPGHTIIFCPNFGNQNSASNGNARVFSMTGQEKGEQQDPDTMTG